MLSKADNKEDEAMTVIRNTHLVFQVFLRRLFEPVIEYVGRHGFLGRRYPTDIKVFMVPGIRNIDITNIVLMSAASLCLLDNFTFVRRH